MIGVLLGALALLGGLLVAVRFGSPQAVELVERRLSHRAAPWIFGAVAALCCWWGAGATLNVEPISTDEAAYLLQAKIFAAGHFTAPAPPIPEFFEQPWVMETPRIYAKYPPGHSLLLAPGVAVGLPWLVPFGLAFAAGALLFALLRRGVGPAAALLTWVAWVLSSMTLAWQTSYFSETTLLACWLGAGACVWQWLDGRGERWLLTAGLLAGYGAITRPLSILLLLLPVAFVVVRTGIRRRRWSELLRAAAVTGGVLLFLPLWNLETTGQVMRSPLTAYTETYIPWDRLGFAIDSSPPLRAPPPDLAPIATHLLEVHRAHTLAQLPRTLYARASELIGILFVGWRIVLLVALAFGVTRLGGFGKVAGVALLAEFFGHAVWGHEAAWTLYYAESGVVWYLPGAIAVVAGMTWLARRLGAGTEAERRALLGVAIAAPFLFLLSVQDSRYYRDWRSVRAADSRALTDLVATGPDRAIYFVRYGPPRAGRPALIRNDPFLASARAWVVYDLGARDAELMRAAPDRPAFLVNEGTREVTPMALPPSPPKAP